MDDNFKTIARVGIAAKGITYVIAGVLTFMAACNMGGEKAGKAQVFRFIEEQPFGKFLLVIMAIGLLSYAFWRLFQAFIDPEDIGNDKKGIFKRVAYFISGIIYIGLTGLAAKRVFGSSGSGDSSDEVEKSSFLATNTGLILLGIVGGIIAIAGIVRLVQAFKKDYTDELKLNAIKNETRRKAVKFFATFGAAARGVIFLIIGYFGLRAALTANPKEIKTTTETFSFLHSSDYGSLLLATVSAGLIAHAFYMLLLARFKYFDD